MPFEGCLGDLEGFGGCACVKNLRCVIKELSGKPDEEVRNSIVRMLRPARLATWHMLRLFESFWSTRMLQVPLRPAKVQMFRRNVLANLGDRCCRGHLLNSFDELIEFLP